MMRYYMFIYTSLVMTFLSYFCCAMEISSKIDFDSLESSKILADNTKKYNLKFSDENNKDKISSISIYCEGSENCNKAESSQSKSGDSIQTDVVVHVKTSIDLNNKTKYSIDDTPDIPVVTGTLDKEHNQYLSIPSISSLSENKFLSKTSTSLPHTTSLNYPHQVYVVPDANFGHIYEQNSNYPTAQRRTNINIEALLNKEDTTVNKKYNVNGVEFHIPRFESAYHNHYFGENPPQQVIWYPKSTLNGFKNKNPLKPSFWPSDPVTTTQNNIRSETTSLCKNKIRTGLEWYPTQRIYTVNPGSEINDKLGRLN